MDYGIDVHIVHIAYRITCKNLRVRKFNFETEYAEKKNQNLT